MSADTGASSRTGTTPGSPPSRRTRATARTLRAEHPDLLQRPTSSPPPVARLDGFLETRPWSLAAPRYGARTTRRSPAGTLVGPYRIVGAARSRRHGRRLPRDRPAAGSRRRVEDADRAERRRCAGVERFLREARLTASLDHPNIVKVFDVGMSNSGRTWSSELLEGETLRAPIERGPLPRHEVAAHRVR